MKTELKKRENLDGYYLEVQAETPTEYLALDSISSKLRNGYIDPSDFTVDVLGVGIFHPLKFTENEMLMPASPDEIATERLVAAVKVLIDIYWQNQDQDGMTCPHPGEFIATITDRGIPDWWRELRDAMRALEER